MVKWLINHLKKYHAQLITASRGNSHLPNKLKCDIALEYNNQCYLLDIGFTNDLKTYYSGKIHKY